MTDSEFIAELRGLRMEQRRTNEQLGRFLPRDEANQRELKIRRLVAGVVALTLAMGGFVIAGSFRSQSLCHKADDSKTAIRNLVDLASQITPKVVVPPDADPATKAALQERRDRSERFFRDGRALARPIDCRFFGDLSRAQVLGLAVMGVAAVTALFVAMFPCARKRLAQMATYPLRVIRRRRE